MVSDVSGAIKVEKLDEEQLRKKGVYSWPTWEKEKSRFDWTYDSIEQCYFLEGDVTVETAEGKVQIEKGDFVTFSKGLSCIWDIRKPVRKHYRFT